MIKTSLGFLAGVLSMAVVVYLTGAHLAAPMFFAGMVAVLTPAIALLASIQRIRSAARFLSAFAHAWEKRIGPDAPQPQQVDPLGEEITSALVNMGTPKKAAAAAAAAATQQHREFDPAFRAALLLVPKTRRAS